MTVAALFKIAFGMFAIFIDILRFRVALSVSTSRSRDGLETYPGSRLVSKVFSNVSVSSRSRGSGSRSRLGLVGWRLGFKDQGLETLDYI